MKKLFYLFENLFAKGLIYAGMSGGSAWLLGGVLAVCLIFGSVCAGAFLVFSQINSCRQNNANKKIDQIKTNIQEKKIEANYAENQVSNSAVNSNQALNNYANVERIDSNKYSGADADDKFCSRYPNDSSRAGWRSRHGK